jgi:GNAT superfamily N-acetyltransferase
MHTAPTGAGEAGMTAAATTTMETIRIDPCDKALIRKFIDFPTTIYAGNDCYVPWFEKEMANYLSKRHAFFSHSVGDFFLVRRGGRTLGRIAALENRRHNDYHKRKTGRFYFYECVEDREVSARLMEAACDWARQRGLTELTGPYGFNSFTGGGLLVNGFEERAAMTMMNYHPPYYHKLLEEAGFSKVMDFYSARLETARFTLPDKVRRAAEITLKRGNFRVPRFTRIGQVKALAADIGRVYNESFAGHEDFTPLSDGEIKELSRDLLRATHPALLKVLFYKEEIAGFLFAFPDLSAALQRGRGKLSLRTLLDLRREARRTDRLIINGAGILPRFQKLGGNALLYYELEQTVKETLGGRSFVCADLTQIAEKTELMLKDIGTLGGKIYKTHRIYTLAL